MKDWLGNDLNVRDFIIIDSSKFSGRRAMAGLVVGVDEEKKTLHYVAVYEPISSWAPVKKKTRLLEAITKYDPKLVPTDVAKKLWTEAQKYV